MSDETGTAHDKQNHDPRKDSEITSHDKDDQRKQPIATTRRATTAKDSNGKNDDDGKGEKKKSPAKSR